jgi:hypothetical protein
LAYIEIAKKQFPNNKIYGQLVISQDVLVSDQLSKVIKEYNNTKADGLLIWIDGLEEASAGEEFLEGLISLSGSLSETKKVINLYGGYFSILLIKKNKLHGVCHGLEYGESRGVVPVGGGIPMAKYYFYPLHQRIRFTDFIKILKQKGWDKNIEDFKSSVCDCNICNDGNIAKYGITRPIKYKRGAQIITLNYPTPETKDYSLKHYLKSKEKEFRLISSKPQADLLKNLENAFVDYKKILGLDEIIYLNVWKKLIENIKK